MSGIHLMRHSRAFTLVELLVVIAIIVLLIAMLLPGVQAAREAARKTTCLNHFRQVSLGVLNYTSANNDRLPPLFSGAGWPFAVGWRLSVLPFLEEGVVSDLVDFDVDASDPTNQAFASTVMPVFQCPSTPGYPRLLVTADGDYSVGARDQVAVSGVGVQRGSDVEWLPGGWSRASTREIAAASIGRFKEANFAHMRQAKLVAIEDGLSKTLMMVEQAGIPQVYEGRSPVELNGVGTISLGWPWFSWDLLNIHLDPPRDPINHRNYRGIYSFHHGAAVAANFDGSVFTLSADIDQQAIINRLVKNDGK